MSLIPFILDLADELHEFSRCLANGIDINDFGFGLYTGSDQQQPQHHQQQQQSSPRRSRTSSFSSFWMPSKRHHPYNRIKTACCAKSGEESVATPEKSDATPSSSSIGGTPGKSASYSVVNKNGFQVSMNVKQFAPNELSVKTIDNCIVVEGRHDDKEDGHGVISRHFVRKYMLPKGYDPNDVLSTLSSDGILTVKAPPPPPPTAKNDETNERIIEIQPTSGPTPVLLVSAKETPTKETTKKVATPSARLECQLPEKRQKLDLPPEPESTETVIPLPTKSTPPTPPPLSTTANVNETTASAATTDEELQDVEMEKSEEEKITEIVTKKPETQTENNDEKKDEIKESTEQEKIIVETEKKLLEEETKAAESNGETKNACEEMEESCSSVTVAAVTTLEKVFEIAAETSIKTDADVDNSNVTKMEVDGDDDNVNNANDDGIKNDNTGHVNNATEKTEITTDSEKTNNIDTSISNNISTNTATNNINSTNTTTADTAKDGGNDENGVVTGKIPVGIPKSSEDCCDADTAVIDTVVAVTATTDIPAESAIGAEADLETAVVLSTDSTTTTIIMDEVALLKAATADPAILTDKEDEENIILSEAIDGIAATDTAGTDSVECSMFAKKTHLGNGNNATTLVGTEEVVN